ncbi:PREDICTED: uncharacterized protein LOC109476565 [Branchiostoma belcheri]|uniref:Uncharacterized protein LOC109476565 n=1 Tax=Branchiostoma belcheri TaxID=7741 RepID=A0A6P4ZGI0_BRABE|nr:PREDICTED: uncharacterized protein LOC109476565 [Branchiostoma belcheri]
MASQTEETATDDSLEESNTDKQENVPEKASEEIISEKEVVKSEKASDENINEKASEESIVDNQEDVKTEKILPENEKDATENAVPDEPTVVNGSVAGGTVNGNGGLSGPSTPDVASNHTEGDPDEIVQECPKCKMYLYSSSL